jgi:predicted peptidase
MVASLEQILSHPEGQLPYLLQVKRRPDEDPETPVPLILFLHGAGERGTDLDAVRRHGIPRVAARIEAFPFIAVSPQCPRGMYWTELTALLRRLLDEIELHHPVDQDRVYLTGISMGGFGVWKLLAESPGRFAAAAPICGGGDPAWAPRVANVPIWAFHGSDDDVVPADQSIRMVVALQELGAPVRFTLYDRVGHDSWTRTYDDPELYEWLGRHRTSFRRG